MAMSYVPVRTIRARRPLDHVLVDAADEDPIQLCLLLEHRARLLLELGFHACCDKRCCCHGRSLPADVKQILAYR